MLFINNSDTNWTIKPEACVWFCSSFGNHATTNEHELVSGWLFTDTQKQLQSAVCVCVCPLCPLFTFTSIYKWTQHYTSPVRLYCNSCHSFSISLGKKKLKHLWHVSLLWTLWIFIQKTRRWMLKLYRPLRMPRNINHHNVKYCH